MTGTPQTQNRASLRRRQQAKLEQEIATFFRCAGVKSVDLSAMFQT